MNKGATVIGVVGAGSMGAGIAQLAVQSGARTLLYDPIPDALAKGLERVRAGLEKARAKGWAGEDTLEPATALAALGDCRLVIEAAPESLEIKRALLGELAAIVAPDAVLATNTSSLSVTALAAQVPNPERVVGMHFFNPAPVMRLLEVVAGDASGEAALALARATGEAMGKHVIDAADRPGFLVNRSNRPFGLEAMRLVQDGIATPEQVDRIMRMGGGFRMGPFELMDLVGIDVGLEISKSFYEQSFGEPRWRPSPLAAQLVAAGRLGRKTGRGWYSYPDHRPEDPPAPEPGGGAGGLVVVAGATRLAEDLRDAAEGAGWDVAWPEEAAGELPELIIDCGSTEDDPPLQGGPQLVLCDTGPLAALDPDGTSVGFFAFAPLGALVELTRAPTSSPAAIAAAERFFASIGRHVEWVRDAPGLVLGRIVAQVINEACFALGEGVGSAGDIDAGMELGLNHPRGPLGWADLVGPAEVLAVLDGLHTEYREERYRPATELTRCAREGSSLHPAH
jgi:3-hydroxybutyryl-CoA dehydrogenase